MRTCKKQCVKVKVELRGKTTIRLQATVSCSLLERVDLEYKIVAADVFLQTSLQSSQHLHLEDYTWTEEMLQTQ